MTSSILYLGGQFLLLALMYPVVQLQSEAPELLANKMIIMDNGIVGRSEEGWSKKWDMCPIGMRATGFVLKTENYQGPSADDTSVNGVRLLCGDGKKENQQPTSEHSRYGQWGKEYRCPDTYFITSFRSSFDAPRDISKKYDLIGLDNVQFLCVPPNKKLDERVLKEVPQPKSRQNIGGYRQYWTAWSDRCSKGICGINTNVDPRAKGSNIDVTGMNDVRFMCC